MNQALFFYQLGVQLEKTGYRVAHVCFHEGSHERLSAMGARSFNAFRQTVSPADLSDYAIDHLYLVLGHEKAAYGLSDSQRLVRKLCAHLGAMSAIFEQLQRQAPGPIYLVQELGGFLSVLAAFFEARRRGIPNLFIEPSFFRGRVFLVRDSLAALRVGGPCGRPISREVDEYLSNALAQQSAVIPLKDRLHYRPPARKLLDARNFRRLLEKSVEKHLRGKQEEFQHIAGHVLRHLRMLLTYHRLKARYELMPQDAPFIYYPLHVPADFALTIRSPEYLDQIAVLAYLARAIPYPYQLAVKEHPALVGAVPLARMRELLDAHDNVVLLDPALKNYEVMRRAAVVVTVNSKSGAEALLLGKPVVVLGDAFYRSCGLVYPVDRLSDLPSILLQAARGGPAIDPVSIRTYFQDVWAASWPGELYDLTPDNITSFADSLHQYFATH